MKGISAVCGLIGMCLLYGCSSAPTVVGKWQAIEVPGDYQRRGIDAITIDIQEDKTFAIDLLSDSDKEFDGFSGVWRYTVENTHIEFEVLNPETHEMGTGELLEDGRLKTVGGKYVMYNERITQHNP